MRPLNGDFLTESLPIWKLLPQVEALPTLRPWSEFTSMRLKTHRLPKYALFHCFRVAMQFPYLGAIHIGFLIFLCDKKKCVIAQPFPELTIHEGYTIVPWDMSLKLSMTQDPTQF